jgi:hypothetical protein
MWNGASRSLTFYSFGYILKLMDANVFLTIDKIQNNRHENKAMLFMPDTAKFINHRFILLLNINRKEPFLLTSPQFCGVRWEVNGHRSESFYCRNDTTLAFVSSG